MRRGSELPGRPAAWREDPTAAAIHLWLNRHYPRTGTCEECFWEVGTEHEKGGTQYAFLRHPEPYTRNREDYQELCRSCHTKLDIELGARDPEALVIRPADTTSMRMQPLEPILEQYVAHLTRKGRDPKTIARCRRALERFSEWCCHDMDLLPQDASEVDIEEYVAWMTGSLAVTTAHRETGYVKAAFRYAARRGGVQKSPAAHVEAPKLPEKEPEVFSNAELRKIRAVIANAEERKIFYGLAYTGMRRHELAQLRWEDFDPDLGYVLVHGKGGKLRRVPLHSRLVAVLEPLRGEPGATIVGGSTRTLNRRVDALLRRAGVDGGNRPAHRFRKTVATSMTEEGVSPDVIDKILGWAPSSIRSRYYSRLPEKALQDAIQKLYASDPIE